MDKPPPPRPAVLVHGGAWAIPDDEWKAHREGVERAAKAAWAILSGGGEALDAVEAAIALMEDDPTYDAGVGSVLTRDGHVEMDAAAMDGRDLRVGAVACVRTARHPIRLAREVMRSDHVLLVGDGAERFARQRGVEVCDPAQFIVERERRRLAAWLAAPGGSDPKSAFDRPPIESSDPRTSREPRSAADAGAGREARRPRVVDPLDSRDRPLTDPPKDGGGLSGPAGPHRPPKPHGPPGPHGPRGTVGCVAVDRGGNIAAGGSTGGTPGKPSGRVGDTPIAGAGLWADNRIGGAACTGWGEGILRVGLARTAVSYLRDASAQDAAYMAIREMESRVDGRAGVILLSRDGSLGFAFNTPRMAVAFMDEELAQPWVK